jgi:hypothetical protein
MRKLESYDAFLKALLKNLATKSVFKSTPDLSEILHNQRLVVVMNHASPLSWIPAMCLLATKAVAAGGGDRIPRGIVDKWFYSNPLSAAVAEFLTQSDRFLGFEELIENFRKSKKSDIIVFPEGANSFFESDNSIKTFRSSRFIEIALRTKAPILLAVHKGSENWSKHIPVPAQLGSMLLPFSEFFAHKIEQQGSLAIPWIEKMPVFKMKCSIYEPEIKIKQLPEDINERKLLLNQEGERLKNKMTSVWDQL